jgi:hypothetical protein
MMERKGHLSILVILRILLMGVEGMDIVMWIRLALIIRMRRTRWSVSCQGRIGNADTNATTNPNPNPAMRRRLEGKERHERHDSKEKAREEATIKTISMDLKSSSAELMWM